MQVWYILGYTNADADQSDPEARGPYLRIIRDLDVSEEAGKLKMREVLESVLKNLAEAGPLRVGMNI